MPPKKAPPKKGDVNEKEEITIPMNTCDFWIEMEVKQEAGHYLKVKYNWITVDPATGEASWPQLDTGFLKEWTLVQIEGEEPIAEQSQETIPPPGGKGAPAKAAPKKPDPKKGAKMGALEEITDNRPRIVRYERDCTEENNGIGLQVTEEVALKFAQAQLRIEIWETDRETQEETLLDAVAMDLSSFLFPKDNIKVSFSCHAAPFSTLTSVAFAVPVPILQSCLQQGSLP